MVIFDFRCHGCGKEAEVLFASIPLIVAELPCSCGGVAVKLPAAPGIKNKSKGLYPSYDVQAGQTFESAQDRENWAKKKGRWAFRPGEAKEILSAEEHKRTVNNAHEPDVEIDSGSLREAMDAAWYEQEQGIVTPHRITNDKDFTWIGPKE